MPKSRILELTINQPFLANLPGLSCLFRKNIGLHIKLDILFKFTIRLNWKYFRKYRRRKKLRQEITTRVQKN